MCFTQCTFDIPGQYAKPIHRLLVIHKLDTVHLPYPDMDVCLSTHTLSLTHTHIQQVPRVVIPATWCGSGLTDLTMTAKPVFNVLVPPPQNLF